MHQGDTIKHYLNFNIPNHYLTIMLNAHHFKKKKIKKKENNIPEDEETAKEIRKQV